MMAYCIDLRHKILQSCEGRLGSQRSLADLCGVSLSFVEKLGCVDELSEYDPQCDYMNKS